MKFTLFFIALFVCIISTCLGKPSSPQDEPSTLGSPETPSLSTLAPLGKVLFVAVVGSRSHKNFYYGIIEALASAGYEVTVLTPYKPARTLKNVREIVLESNDIAPFMPNIFESKMGPMSRMLTLGADLCLEALGSAAYAEVLQEEFDIAFVSMFFNECFLGRINAWNIPFVFVSPSEVVGSGAATRMGSVHFPATDSNPMFVFPLPKSFLHRFISTIGEFFAIGLYKYIGYSLDAASRSRGLISPDTPYLPSIYPNASLMIGNSFRLAETPRVYMPNILPAGGIHLKPPKPLPQDLEDWVQSSGDAGFIFFSLGTAVRASDMPKEAVTAMISVFKSLKQKVLWKFNIEDIEDELPPNVRLTSWAPQQDLLGHPKMRLFITHGGLLSTQEATYHGVPVLGIPVFGDQTGNMKRAEAEGWGLKLDWADINYDRLMSAILSLIDDHKAREKVAKLGALMRDRPTSPADDVVWWTGYIIRTGGARHLRSGGLNLTWYELYNIDVWAVVVLVTLLGLWVDYKILRALYRRCCGTPAKLASKKHKQK